MQDIIIFVLVGISLISGVVLLFDVRSLKLPHLPLPHIALPRPSSLLRSLPFFGRGGSQDEDEDPEYDAYEVYPAVDYGDEDAGSFAASRSPFAAPVPSRRRQMDEDEEEDEDLGFDYKPAAYDTEDDYEAPVAELEDVGDAEAGEDEDDDEEEEDEEQDDADDLMAFFDKAPEVSKVPDAIREGIEHVSAAELLADARELSALLRRTNRG